MHTPTTQGHVGLGSIAHTQQMSLWLVLLFYLLYYPKCSIMLYDECFWRYVGTLVSCNYLYNSYRLFCEIPIVKRRPKVLIHESLKNIRKHRKEKDLVSRRSLLFGLFEGYFTKCRHFMGFSFQVVNPLLGDSCVTHFDQHFCMQYGHFLGEIDPSKCRFGNLLGSMDLVYTPYFRSSCMMLYVLV